MLEELVVDELKVTGVSGYIQCFGLVRSWIVTRVCGAASWRAE